jgi:hypothetical protein
MLYRQTNGSANGGPRCLSGASISQLIRHMSPTERAILGAELVEGRIVLEPPTAKTVGGLVGVNQSYVFAALKLTPAQRGAVLAGERPLIEPRRCASAPIDWTNVETGKIVEAIKMIGLDRTLDAAIEVERST